MLLDLIELRVSLYLFIFNIGSENESCIESDMKSAYVADVQLQ